MSYFVTGATGFIGRFLVERLLEREGTVYVLVREGSKGRLEELRSRWGADPERVVGIVGDLSQRRLGISDSGHRAPAGRRSRLPPGGDLRHDRQRGGPARGEYRRHAPHGPVRGGRRGRPRPPGLVDRDRRALQGHLARGHVRRRPRASTSTPTSGPSTTRRESFGTSAAARGGSTGRASSSGIPRPARWTRSTVRTTSSS